MKLSVIVVLYNEFDIVQRCLRSIYDNQIPSMEVLLVDNSDKIGVKKVLKKFSKLKYIKNKTNLGFARAVNVGFEHAKGEFFLVLTPDTQLLPNTIRQTFNFIQKHPKVALVGCRFYSHPRKMHECAFHSFPNLVSHLYEFNTVFYKLWKRFAKSEHPIMYSLEEHKKELHPAHMIGVYMLLRKKAGQEIGFLDRQFKMFREETDMCKRLRDSGWDITYLPVGGIIHYGGAEWKTFKITQCSDHYMRSTYLFFKKHYGFFYSFIAWFLALLSAIMCIPVLFITVLVRKIQRRESQSTILLPCWVKILQWHLTVGVRMVFSI